MIYVGEVWELDHNDSLPSIHELINKPIREKEKILEYMKKCRVDAVAPAIVRDVINPESRIPKLFLMSDGTYGWRSDVIYYVEKYDMALPDEFLQHVVEKIELNKRESDIAKEIRAAIKQGMSRRFRSIWRMAQTFSIGLLLSEHGCMLRPPAES